VKILLATDAAWIVDDVVAALSGEGVQFLVCREGRIVSRQVAAQEPDLVITDLQIGSMGGMAVTMALRLDESAGAVPHVPVLMLLDREADIHLARRSGAEGWLVKPINPLTLKRATTALLDGGTYTDGVARAKPIIGGPDPDEEPVEAEDPAEATAEDSAEEEPAPAG
jgi:DNA-binding response OmpR family regulator